MSSVLSQGRAWGSLLENGKRPEWTMHILGPGRAAHTPVTSIKNQAQHASWDPPHALPETSC